VSETLNEVTSILLGLLQTFMPFLCTFLLDMLQLDGHKLASKSLRELPKLTEEECAALVGRIAKKERKLAKGEEEEDRQSQSA
jgi:hypothetical protein